MQQIMRKAIQDLKPYHAPYITEGIKLDANENTYPILQGLKEHMAKWVMEMPINCYPDTDSMKLRKAIGEAYGLGPQHVICGVGSDQLIDCILRAFVEKDEVVLAPTPSFSMYGLSTKLNEGSFYAVPLKQDFTYDRGKILQAIQRIEPKLLFICNPNNPTGTVVEKDVVEEMIKAMKGIVVIDEAYAEFHEETMVSLIDKYSNVIILRTFSKAYGLAGARIGYGLASKDLIQTLDVVRPPYNINVFSQEVAYYVVTHREDFKPVIEQIKKNREKMREALIELGFEVSLSATNFLWFKTDLPLEKLFKEEKIYVKMFTYQGENYCRLSIGTESENEQVLDMLRKSVRERR